MSSKPESGGRLRQRARKRFGQHFLQDASALAQIAELARSPESHLVLEVGPGRGALTTELLKRLPRLVAVEIDRDLAGTLAERFDTTALRVIEADVLDLDLQRLLREEGKQRLVVVGNLPFNITAPILFRLLEHASSMERAVLTLQKEVARRVVAAPGSKSYGLITVLLSMRAEARIQLDIPRTAFRPRPQVDAAVVELTFSGQCRFPVLSEAVFDKVARAAFGQRRKMLRNALRSLASLPSDVDATDRYLSDEDIGRAADSSGIDLSRRAETLATAEFAALSDALFEVAQDASAVPCGEVGD